MTENSELYTTSTEDSSPKGKQNKPAVTVEETPLQKLTSVVKKKVERQVVLIPVPERPGVKIKISPNITQNQMKNWRKQAGEDTRNSFCLLSYRSYNRWNLV